ncbi:uncharacterized protein EHS24_000869 [Apiotrichum porosum]|uniref:Uncharacterized protein n=1 Tax=Apiotrichum porosum TaxID=105984 RepID=A0A427YB48_9TREE|nr:uncharacterized protein EHS24_000869 [Apiotrichum porosum]RSH88332.1 hypothetical protein EHS24_000869 [Apiotrichum porosum]
MATTLFTLPEHLRDAISALVDAHIVPLDLESDMEAALAAADVVEFEEVFELNPETKNKPAAETTSTTATAEGDDTAIGTEKQAQPSDKSKEKQDTPSDNKGIVVPLGDELPPVPTLRPATIDGDLLERISRWVGGDDGSKAVEKAGLDAAPYGPIAILAGSEVYLPPRQRALAKAAEAEQAKKEELNPYLPASMSVTPPSLGSEYRQLMRQLSNVLNVLFSIFGCGGAAYVAAVTGGGWAREPAILLAVIVGFVVGMADVGLIFLYKRRLTIERRAAAERRVKENKGSAAIGEGTVLELDEDKVAELERELAEEGPVDIVPAPSGSGRSIRLRRRAL